MSEVSSAGLGRYGFLHDPESRRLRGRRIVRALRDIGGMDVARARVLDIGCSAGLMTDEISRSASWTAGIDADAIAIRHAATLARANLAFAVASGQALPFRDAVFDAVVCNHVYEHVADPYALMAEVRRVLKPGGVCYCATGHTLQMIEPHHRLPMLSLLPRPLADRCVRWAGRCARYEEHFLPPWRLRSLFDGFASAELVSPKMLRAPEAYELASLARLPSPLRRVVAALADALALAAPTWIWIARR